MSVTPNVRGSYPPKVNIRTVDRPKTLPVTDSVNISATGLDNFEDQLDYFKTLCGYSITGETRDEIFTIPQGEGGCGKNTITWPIHGAMGSYVQQVDPNILVTKGDFFRSDYYERGRTNYLVASSQFACTRNKI